MKISISYIPAEAKIADAVLKLLLDFLPGAKLRSSISHPPRKIVYLTTERPVKDCNSKKNA